MYNFLSVTWNVDPILFKIGSFELRWYSLMFVFSFAIGLYIYKKMLVREKKPIALFDNIFFPVFLGTFLGARIGHFLFYEPQAFINNFWYIFIPMKDGKFEGFQGLASHGAAIGILIALYYYSRKNKVTYLWTLDRIVITIALSGFFIRIGNLINSEIIGKETEMPWGFVFSRLHETVPRHPTQIYEALAYLLIFAILYLIYLKKKPQFKDGIIFSLFLILVFSARFIIEFWKDVQVDFEQNMTIDMGQWLSVPLIIAGFVLLIFLQRNKKTIKPIKK